MPSMSLITGGLSTVSSMGIVTFGLSTLLSVSIFQQRFKSAQFYWEAAKIASRFLENYQDRGCC